MTNCINAFVFCTWLFTERHVYIATHDHLSSSDNCHRACQLTGCFHGQYEYSKCSKNLNTFEPPHDKTNNVAVRPAKTQISLGIRPVWSEPSKEFAVRLLGWSESSLGAQSICWFCHVAAHFCFNKRLMKQLQPQIQLLLNRYYCSSSCASIYEPRHENTCLWGFRPGKTQTGLRSHRS